jgi:CHAT domain-containing protein
VLGFGQALLGAGARTVVATLWPVADEVAAFEMESFYRRLLAGTERAEALRAAALATRDELARGGFRGPAGAPLAADPALWSAFVLLGEPR